MSVSIDDLLASMTLATNDAEEPVAEEPAAEEPVAEEPVAEEPAAEEPVADELAEEAPAEEAPAEEAPAEEAPCNQAFEFDEDDMLMPDCTSSAAAAPAPPCAAVDEFEFDEDIEVDAPACVTADDLTSNVVAVPDLETITEHEDEDAAAAAHEETACAAPNPVLGASLEGYKVTPMNALKEEQAFCRVECSGSACPSMREEAVVHIVAEDFTDPRLRR